MARSRRRHRSAERAQPSRRRRYNLRETRSRRRRLLGGDNEGRRMSLFNDQEFREKLKPIKTLTEAKNALTVTEVDLQKEANRTKHHTDEFEKEDLIVRRGQGFDLVLTFDRNIDKDKDLIILQFTTGARPQESKGSLLRLRLLSKKNLPKRSRDWSVNNVTISDNKVTASISPHARAIVGRYTLYVETRQDAESGVNRYEEESEEIFVLFNPWCKDDTTYMEDSEGRDEYVMRDYGRIWVGSAKNHSGRPWNFGQFDDPCLDAALLLLDKGELGDSARGNPVAVLRVISAMANSNDEYGVLEGRWTSTYPKSCTAPWAWSGSVAILKQYVDTDKPVQFGQCWVFSGIVTTLMRALGIPTRSVTNFESAHDIDGSMTIDKHWNEEGESVDYLDDSVWNFHVWNEAFIRRLDLPSGYDGWQAFDSTPQELSEGIMRCGPASLRAVKDGHVYLSYDTAFIFSEVNGDKIHWLVGEDDEMEVLRIDSKSVGKNISTKAKGSRDREDITHLYKYPDGSSKEAEVVAFVNRFSTRKDEEIYQKTYDNDVEFTLDVPDTASVADDFQVSILIRNTSDEARSVKGRMSIMTSYYTGIPAKRLKGELTDLVIQAKQQEKITIDLTTQEFQSKLNPEANFLVMVNYKISETNQKWADTETFNLLKPPLIIEVPSELHPKKKYVGKVTFTNPLNIKVIGASIHVEGGIGIGSQTFEHKKAVKPNETISFEFNINPRRRGTREVAASLSSDQLCGIDGSSEYIVT